MTGLVVSSAKREDDDDVTKALELYARQLNNEPEEELTMLAGMLTNTSLEIDVFSRIIVVGQETLIAEVVTVKPQ